MSKFILKTSVEKLAGIYKITSPTKKVYIGQSIDIEKRLRSYSALHCKTQKALYRSLLKYGTNKHTFEVLEYCDVDLLNDKERYYQDLYSAMGVNGLNLVLTKTSDKSGKLSEEVKEKIRKSLTGTKRPQELKDKLRKAHLGRTASEETKQKMRGRKHTEETKEKIRLSYQNKSDLYKYNKRKALSENEENNKRLLEFNKKRSIKVKCFDRYTNELIGVFESMSEASRKTGVNLKCMWESLKKGKYAKGKYFEYV